jgi:hypothetical protein
VAIYILRPAAHHFAEHHIVVLLALFRLEGEGGGKGKLML